MLHLEINFLFYLLQQVQLPSVMPTLVQAMAQYICILLAALAMRPTLMTALKLTLMSIVCKATQRMLV